MTKVYVVTKGAYSDYHIVAVTLDKELAGKFVDQFKHVHTNDSMDVEEYDLSRDTRMLGGELVYLFYVIGDGKLHYVDWAVDYFRETPYYNMSLFIGGEVTMYCAIQAKTLKVAIQTAHEHRKQLIADGKWVADDNE